MNKFRNALLNKEVSLGAWMQIGHCAVAEIFARSGFDWVCVDLEHGAIDLEKMTNIFRTIDAFDCTPVARLPYNDPVWIHRSLDAGARGLIIPMVNSAQEAENAIIEAKYPPRGKRGFGYSRANMHGIDFDQYIKTANGDIAMVMQIEHKDAITNLEEISQVEGVDGFFIGPLDLSGSMGITGQLEHPDMIAALDKYKRVCKDSGLSAGMHIVRPDEKNIKSAIDQGYTLIALGLDNVFLDESSRAVLKAAGN
ncbi:MAG: HpcH/HpaI aldolase/citrate lyase family protein [Sedimentisphaeraceae bacterium JB056]